MNRIKQMLAVGLALLITFAFLPAPTMASDVNSGPTTVTLTMNIAETLTISTNINAVNFTYNPAGAGTATASAPVVVTVVYNLSAGHAYYALIGWMSSSTAALSGSSGGAIPASEFFVDSGDGNGPIACSGTGVWGGQVGGVANAACGKQGVGGSALMVIQNPTVLAGTTTTTLTLSMNNLGQLPVQNYSGVLNLEADAD